MPFTLHEVASEAEFPPIVAVEHEAYSTPFSGFWEALKGSSQEECAARQWSWHKHDPSSHWLYVTDDDAGGEVIAATQWNIYEANPYANGPPALQAYWWPEGNLKELTEQILRAFFGGRPRHMAKPHFLISYCFVKTTHRHRGAGSLMMEWGTKKADELGMESFVESSEDGRGLYEAHGFKVYGDFLLDAKLEEPNTDFTALAKKLKLPLHGWYMWRPKDGMSEEKEPCKTA